MKVYFIRHAKTEDDLNGMTQTDGSQIILDIETLAKTRDIKQKLKDIKVFSSPLRRAIQTAQLISDGFSTIKHFREVISPKVTETMTHDERKAFWEKNKESKTNPNWKNDGSESFNQIKKRVEKAYRFLNKQKRKYKENEIAIVTHSNFLKHLLFYKVNKNYTQEDYYLIYPLYWDNLSIIEVKEI